ncbi:MAG: hypothetical protein AAGE59_34340 [Cyanobacteria bacterium P01_F01_bin.86]
MDKKRNRGVMLFISVLIHSLLALLPWQEKSRPLAVSSTPTSPTSPAGSISVVDASQLPTLSASESQPAPFSPPEPAISPPADPPPADALISETSDDPEPAPEAAPEPDWTADASIPETVDSPIGSTAPDAVPNPGAAPNNNFTSGTSADDEAKIAAAEWAQLVSYLKDQDEGFGFDLFDIFDNFGETDQANQFFYEKNQPKLEVSSFSHFPTQTPEQVFQTVVKPELTQNTGFDPQPQESSSVRLVYQLLQGDMLRYLIIVKLREGEGSVLMLSESLAGLEP